MIRKLESGINSILVLSLLLNRKTKKNSVEYGGVRLYLVTNVKQLNGDISTDLDSTKKIKRNLLTSCTCLYMYNTFLFWMGDQHFCTFTSHSSIKMDQAIEVHLRRNNWSHWKNVQALNNNFPRFWTNISSVALFCFVVSKYFGRIPSLQCYRWGTDNHSSQESSIHLPY